MRFTALSITLALMSSSASAQDASWVELFSVSPPQSPVFSVWGKSLTIPSVYFQKNLPTMLDAIVTHPELGPDLPENVGILLDGTWNKSAGFWSDTLKTPTGNIPAILLSPSSLLDQQSGTRLLAHELTHMIHHRYRPNEDSWVREGIALLFEYFVTGYISPAFRVGFWEPESSLVQEMDPRNPEYSDTTERAAQYGHLSQYFYYLYRWCGNEPLIKNMMKISSPSKGVRWVNQILQLNYKQRRATPLPEVCQSFKASFVSFQKARFQPDLLRKGESILPSSLLKATRRNSETAIPPYSAQAYRSTTGTCPTQQIALFNGYCLKIRFE